MKSPVFISVIIAILLLSASVSLAADGIDSVENTDLPLNAGGKLVAVLSASTLNVELNKGIKVRGVGDNSATACAPADEGVMRYNSSEKEMQYCDGSLWKASMSSGEDCPKTYFYTQFCGSRLCEAGGNDRAGWYEGALSGDSNVQGRLVGAPPLRFLPDAKSGQTYVLSKTVNSRAGNDVVTNIPYYHYYQCMDGTWKDIGGSVEPTQYNCLTYSTCTIYLK